MTASLAGSLALLPPIIREGSDSPVSQVTAAIKKKFESRQKNLCRGSCGDSSYAPTGVRPQKVML